MSRTLVALPISIVWCSLTAFSKFLFRIGLRHSSRLPVRTIVVGNFEAGGTGKTPVVAQIAREAMSRGILPVILTRGYGGRWEKQGGVIEPMEGRESWPDPADCGDEPALLHELVPSAWIGVGVDRAASFERVLSTARNRGSRTPELAILDDGLQYNFLERDLEVVLQTSARPWTRFFREFPSRRRIQALYLWTKGILPPLGWRDIESFFIRLRWRSVTARPVAARSPLWLVTGVADGGEVRVSLEAQGWRVVAHSNCRDHAQYSKEWVTEILSRAHQGGLQPATTGKDWVKWRALGVSDSAVVIFEPEMILESEGRRLWSRVLWGE